MSKEDIQEEAEDNRRLEAVKSKLRQIDNKGILHLNSGIVIIKGMTYNEEKHCIEFEADVLSGDKMAVQDELAKEFVGFVNKELNLIK